ncbi:MAG: lysozyme [Sporomusaceae bacterium]|nr:lysozyme [Sporomusaceae bacterium]
MAYFAIRVNIADRGARYLKEDGSITLSRPGHVWYTLINYQTGAEYNFGFHPSEEGEFYTNPGQVRVDDSAKYLDVAYWKIFPISGESYNAIYNFSQDARANNVYGSYFGPGHACIQFTYAALASGGIYDVSLYVDSGGPTSLWPANNKIIFDTLFNSWMSNEGWNHVYSGDSNASHSSFESNNIGGGATVTPVSKPTRYFLEFDIKPGDGWDTLEAIYGVTIRGFPEYGATQSPVAKRFRIEVTGDELAKLYYSGKLRPGDRSFAIVGDDRLLSHLSAHFAGDEITADSLAQLNLIEKHLGYSGQTITIFSLPNSVVPEADDLQETEAQTANAAKGFFDVTKEFWERSQYYYGIYLGPENRAWIIDEDDEEYDYYEQVKKDAWDAGVAEAAKETLAYLPKFAFEDNNGSNELDNSGEYIFGHKIDAQYAMAGLADFNPNSRSRYNDPINPPDMSLQDNFSPIINAVGQKKLEPSGKLVSYLMDYERYERYEYDAGDGKRTIGYGHVLLPGESYPNGISRADAGLLLSKDLKERYTAASLDPFLKQHNIALTQNQYDALVHLTYNIGEYVWDEEVNPTEEFRLKQLLIVGNFTAEDVTEAFLRWTEVDGVKFGGLWRRRMDEVDMFLKGIYERNDTRLIPDGFE